MALSDKKKVQTFVNVLGQQMQIMRDALAEIEITEALFNADNPSVIGTPLDGKLNQVNGAIPALTTQINKAIWTDMINGIVPSHRNKAL